VAADGVSASVLTVTLKDAFGNPVGAGRTVSVSQTSPLLFPAASINPGSGTTNASGVVTFTVTSTSTNFGNPYTFEARATDASGFCTFGCDLDQTADVTFVAGVPNLANSTRTVIGSPVVADGAQTITVKIRLVDFFNNVVDCPPVITCKTITLTKVSGPGSPTILPASGQQDAAGEVTFTVQSTTAGSVQLTFDDVTDSVNLGTVTVVFIPGPPSDATSTVTVSPLRILDDGISTATVTVTVKDVNGNARANDTVTLTQTSGLGMNLTPVSTQTDITGRAIFTVKSDVITVGTFGAAVSTTDYGAYNPGAGTGNPATVTAVTSGVDPQFATMTVSVTRIPANGVYNAIVTVTLVDGRGGQDCDADFLARGARYHYASIRGERRHKCLRTSQIPDQVLDAWDERSHGFHVRYEGTVQPFLHPCHHARHAVR
jgi:adhesin/invasin